MQSVEVGREFGECQPEVAAVAQGRRVLRVDIAGGADGGGRSGRQVVGAREQPPRIRLTANTIAGPAGLNRLATSRIRLRHRGQQPPRVLVLWPAEHLVAVALFHDDAAEHHDDLVGEMLDHRKIMRDKQI